MAWWLFVVSAILISCGLGSKVWKLWKKRRWKKVTEEQRVEAARQKKMMEELISSPGWELLSRAAEYQMKYRTDTILLDPEVEPLRAKYLAGEVGGIKTFLAIPQGLIDTNEAVLQAWMAQEEEEGRG